MPVCLSPDDFYKPLAPVEWNRGQIPCTFKHDNSCCPPENENYGEPPPPCNENTCDYTSNKREPEYLEDHVMHYHPHLAPKQQVLPKMVFGQSNRPPTG